MFLRREPDYSGSLFHSLSLGKAFLQETPYTRSHSRRERPEKRGRAESRNPEGGAPRVTVRHNYSPADLSDAGISVFPGMPLYPSSQHGRNKRCLQPNLELSGVPYPYSKFDPPDSGWTARPQGWCVLPSTQPLAPVEGGGAYCSSGVGTGFAGTWHQSRLMTNYHTRSEPLLFRFGRTFTTTSTIPAFTWE